jgi:hypothetical protein
MNITELLQKIQTSPLSDATKQSVAAILAGHDTLTIELEAQVQNIIQEEIERDFADLGVDTDTPELHALDEQLAKELQSVDDELSEDMAYVDGELAELDKMRKELNSLEDQQKINDLKEEMVQE